ncbi:MAG: EthD domain-containing protein [Actinobacteria bacterium]|nr:EthD domain-containing protein [Actinomycetota bacterium]
MVKLIALLVKREGLTDVEFHRHWRYNHGPLAAKITSMEAYCQCHLVPRPPADLSIADTFGGTAEVWWEDLDAAARLATDPEYTEHAEPDEPLFIDMDRMIFMTVKEQEVLGSRPAKADGGLKVIHLVTRAEGTDPDEFRARFEAADEAAAAAELKMSRFVRTCCVPEAYTVKPPAFDATREMWWPDEWAFAAARENAAEAWQSLVETPFADASRSHFLVTIENRVVWFGQ